jgi:hypothetical protein
MSIFARGNAISGRGNAIFKPGNVMFAGGNASAATGNVVCTFVLISSSVRLCVICGEN